MLMFMGEAVINLARMPSVPQFTAVCVSKPAHFSADDQEQGIPVTARKHLDVEFFRRVRCLSGPLTPHGRA